MPRISDVSLDDRDGMLQTPVMMKPFAVSLHAHLIRQGFDCEVFEYPHPPEGEVDCDRWSVTFSSKTNRESAQREVDDWNTMGEAT